jgi:hypothetical protein
MSVWSKLFGSKAAEVDPKSSATQIHEAPRPGTPARVVLVPKKLVVDFHAHGSAAGDTAQFLSAVSEGFNRYKQRELAITLRLGPTEDPTEKMRDLTRYFSTVWRWAQEGVLVDAGDCTHFGERGLFGGSANGLVYTDARDIPDVELPPDALAALVVNDEEVRLAMGFGAYRLLARLADHYAQFPFPTWTDLTRPSLATPRELESQLTKLKRVRARGACYLLEKGRIRVSLPVSARAVLAQGIAALAPGAPFALLTDPSPEANALAVWYPGQQEAKTVITEGSQGLRVTGAFLAIVPGGQSDRTNRLEDGYTLQFSSPNWLQVSQALIEKRPLSLNMAGVQLELEWQAGAERAWLT